MNVLRQGLFFSKTSTVCIQWEEILLKYFYDDIKILDTYAILVPVIKRLRYLD